MSVETQDCAEIAETILGQIDKLPGTSCPEGRDRSGTMLYKPLIFLYVSRLDHLGSRKTTLNALVFLDETARQLWLRMVCAFRSPVRAKQTKMHPRLHMGCPFAFPLGSVFGMVVAAIMPLAAPIQAEGWEKASATAGWSSADRFTAETPLPNTRTPSVSFNSFLASLKGGELDKLMSLISRVESPRLGYDSVQVRARIRPPKRPTDMTLGGIFTWIKATPGQQHAIGRYQVIPKTLAYVSRELGLTHATRYDRRTQDKIATFLIMESGYDDFRSGRISRATFMDNLAAVWAGFPLRNGRSKYAGIAGNKATISRAHFERAMASIFPIRRAAK